MKDLSGKTVYVDKCEALLHGDYHNCTCHLIGQQVVLGSWVDPSSLGTNWYYIDGSYRIVSGAGVIEVIPGAD